MKAKKSLKGFTLVELIIVMAIFGIIMVGTMSIINPVNKIIKKASLEEANAAAVDNMKRYFEGSLRYADCIDVFNGSMIDLDGNPVTSEQQAVENFITYHYNNRTDPGTDDPLTGKVRVLKIDNAAGGEVTEYEYEFEAGYTYYKWEEYTDSNGVKDVRKEQEFVYDESGNKVKDPAGNDMTQDVLYSEPCKVTLLSTDNSVINPVYYDKYNFYFIPGYNQQVNTSDTSLIDAATDSAGDLVFDTSEDDPETYYTTVQPATTGMVPFTFKRDLFSLSVMTYKKDHSVGTTAAAAPGTPTDYSKLIFRSPFALTNINISLVNINSQFSSERLTEGYGPIRWSGKAKDGNTYTPTDKVDAETPSNGKWDYEQITTRQSKLVDTRYCGYKAQAGDCIYFVYTLPDMK